MPRRDRLSTSVSQVESCALVKCTFAPPALGSYASMCSYALALSHTKYMMQVARAPSEYRAPICVCVLETALTTCTESCVLASWSITLICESRDSLAYTQCDGLLCSRKSPSHY